VIRVETVGDIAVFLLPEGQADLLQQVVNVILVRQQRQQKGVEVPLVDQQHLHQVSAIGQRLAGLRSRCSHQNSPARGC
jgi:hypothetical protein